MVEQKINDRVIRFQINVNGNDNSSIIQIVLNLYIHRMNQSIRVEFKNYYYYLFF